MPTGLLTVGSEFILTKILRPYFFFNSGTLSDLFSYPHAVVIINVMNGFVKPLTFTLIWQSAVLIR